MSRVTVELSQEDRAMLKQLALRDYRTIGQQAAFLSEYITERAS